MGEAADKEKCYCDIHEFAGKKNVPAHWWVGLVIRACASCKNKYVKLQEQGYNDPAEIQEIIVQRMGKVKETGV